MANLSRHLRSMAGGALMVTIVVVLAAWWGTSAQVAFPSGQNIAPVYEGWEQNPDGSFNLLFGYFNRNFEEDIDLPVGPDNAIEPGGPDQGQPTHFYPRRSRFLFKIRVPKDFGKKEVVWTLTSHGKTERAYATLNPNYFTDDIVIMNDNGAGGMGGGANNLTGNKPPVLAVEGDKKRSATVGQPVTLTAVATDDGIPKRRVNRSFARPTTQAPATGASPSPAPTGESSSSPIPPGYIASKIGSRCCPDSSSGLRLSWFVYRGPASKVAFDPPQFEAWEDYRDSRNSPYSEGWEPPPLPADGKWPPVRATFSEPGTYVLRCLAHDGGLGTSQDVTVVVK